MDHKYNRILKLYESKILGIKERKRTAAYRATQKSKAWMTTMQKEYEKMGGKSADMDWDTAYYHFYNQMDAKEAAKKLLKK